MSAITTLVTGGSGFVGPYLIAALEALGRDVVALGEAPARGTRHYPPEIRPRWRQIDLCDRHAVEAIVRETRPAELYHLAALSSVAASFEDPSQTYQTNLMGTVYLLEAVRRHAPDARVLLVSSAEVYGGLSSPLDENCPFAPANPYAASKVGAEMAGLAYFRAHGLGVVRARAFNHTGPGQLDRFVIAAFAKQIALIEAGRQEPLLRVGNLSARRDFLDVRDVVAAYTALMARGAAGAAYNVASGRAVAMQALLDQLLACSSADVRVETDPALLRPVDVPELVGDRRAIGEATGWEPRIPLDQTLSDVLADWRERVRMLGTPLLA
ncbi:MAG TPA: GDP-mannose 4,6-dehydratase [Oscillatoriaceae cyanobacterium]